MAHTERYASSPNSGREQGAEKHAHHSGSVVLSRTERRVLRSVGMWAVLYLPVLTAIALLGYMAIHLYPGPGRVFGAGDRGSPNAQPGDR
jgi:hypothetical protein